MQMLLSLLSNMVTWKLDPMTGAITGHPWLFNVEGKEEKVDGALSIQCPELEW